MEAKSQQNVYNKAAIVVISSKLSLWSIHFQDLVQQVTKWLIIIHYFRLMLCIAFTLWNNNLGTLSSLNSLGTFVQDMQSCPTHAVESSKIHNGFDTVGSQFQTRQPSLSHTCSIGFKSGNKLGRGRLAMFSCFFLFLHDASTLRSCNVISRHHVLAI